MANFDLGIKLKADKELSADVLKNFIKERLGKSCKYSVASENATSMELTGKVTESVFTTVTKFDATISITVESNKARIGVTGKSSGNWVFWVFSVIGLFTGVFLLIAIILHLLQRNKPKEVLEEILKAVEAEFGAI